MLAALFILGIFLATWIGLTWLLGWPGFFGVLLLLALGWSLERLFVGPRRARRRDSTLAAWQQPLSRETRKSRLP
jgi:hypothetical protein